MKTFVTAFAAGALLSLAAFSNGASAAISDGDVLTPAVAASQTQLAHGWHPTCEQGPRGWWHRHGPILGLPIVCLPRG